MRVIYCAGEQGRVVLDILRSMSEDKGVVFADDNPNLHGESIAGHAVVGLGELRTHDESVECVVAFGDQPGVRLELVNKLADAGCHFYNVIHPSTTISDNVSLGRGLMLNAESYLGPGVEVNDHVLVDSCVSVSHDVCLGRGVTITPGATIAGGVLLDTDSYVGAGATVVEDVTVGESAVVGAGAVVTDNVPPDTTVVGIPASPLDS
jgi:sugar O-acyltransferase (sialic acid O-acetyltransferase NeuD family)